MNTVDIPKEVIERITKEAEAQWESANRFFINSGGVNPSAFRIGYIAGATCEALRAITNDKWAKNYMSGQDEKIERLETCISELEAEIINLKADKSMQKDNL